MDFEVQLDALIAERRLAMHRNWNRVLPSNELFFDRFEKASFLNAGDGSSIYDSSVVMGNVIIGKNVWIGPFCVIEAMHGSIEIGDNCNISSAVHIYSHDSVFSVLTTGRAAFRTGSVRIGNNTYIGSQTVISYNVEIGSFCVIGANTFINSDIDDYSIVFGSPGKKVGEVSIVGSEVKLIYY